MSGKKFLNPRSKIIICLVGFLVLGYFVHAPLYEALFLNGQWDRMLVSRLLVMLAFIYLLARSVKELLTRDNS
ncbi:MAG: hypothetical protein ACP5VS_14750 [Desulfomonilaceae bacterium]